MISKILTATAPITAPYKKPPTIPKATHTTISIDLIGEKFAGIYNAYLGNIQCSGNAAANIAEIVNIIIL